MKRVFLVLLVLFSVFSLGAKTMVAVDGYYDGTFIFVAVAVDSPTHEEVMEIILREYSEDLYSILSFKDDYDVGRVYLYQIGFDRRLAYALYLGKPCYILVGKDDEAFIVSTGKDIPKELIDLVFPNGYVRNIMQV